MLVKLLVKCLQEHVCTDSEKRGVVATPCKRSTSHLQFSTATIPWSYYIFSGGTVDVVVLGKAAVIPCITWIGRYSCISKLAKGSSWSAGQFGIPVMHVLRLAYGVCKLVFL